MEGITYNKFYEELDKVYNSELSEFNSIKNGTKIKNRKSDAVVNKRSRIKQPLTDEARKLTQNIDTSDIGRYTIVETIEEDSSFDKDADVIFSTDPQYKENILPIEYGLKAAWHMLINSPGPFKHGCTLASDYGIIFSAGYPEPPRKHVDNSIWEYNLHATETALLRLQDHQEDAYILNGSCYLTHLPCPNCVKLLSYKFIKSIYYLDVSKEEYTDESHIKHLCQDIYGIELTKIDKEHIKQIYDQDKSNNFTHFLRDTPSDYPCQSLQPEWLKVAIKTTPPR